MSSRIFLGGSGQSALWGYMDRFSSDSPPFRFHRGKKLVHKAIQERQTEKRQWTKKGNSVVERADQQTKGISLFVFCW